MTEFTTRQQRRQAARQQAKVDRATKKHPYPEHKRAAPPAPTSKYAPHQGTQERARRAPCREVSV